MMNAIDFLLPVGSTSLSMRNSASAGAVKVSMPPPVADEEEECVT
jgi:hypothetical protein